jgi:uncharacterized protein (TIGR03066 family)
MYAARVAAAALVALALVAGLRAEEKKADVSKDKLAGTWVVVKCDGDGPPVGTVIKLTKDGKMKVTHNQDGQEVTDDGTYMLDGNKLTVILKHDGDEKTHKATIQKLTDTELVAQHENGTTVEFKRKK